MNSNVLFFALIVLASFCVTEMFVHCRPRPGNATSYVYNNPSDPIGTKHAIRQAQLAAQRKAAAEMRRKAVEEAASRRRKATAIAAGIFGR